MAGPSRRGQIVGASLALIAMATRADARPTVVPPCTPDSGEPVTVQAVAEDFSLELADGRHIRLAGIDPITPTPTQPDLAANARRDMSARLVGQAVLLQTLGDAVDRWGRLPGLVFADPEHDDGGDGLSTSVALAMVNKGLARGRPEPQTHACWADILRAEAAARDAGLGLWADPYYAVRKVDDLATLAAAEGSMAIVQGSVAHVGQGRSQIYIDLGATHAAVTLRVAKRYLFILGQIGLSQSDLVGVNVRARGVLEDHVGPEIDIDDADQIERLADPGRHPAGPSSPPP